jgi:hypothetical protein
MAATAALMSFVVTVWGTAPAQDSPGLRDAVVLVIRHGEKPEIGSELSPEGNERARDYVHYFETFQVDSKPVRLDALFGARDSKKSIRPRLTLEPLSRALNVPLDCTFKDSEPETLARELQSKPRGRNILICWHHEKIPDLLRALGADPNVLLPGGKWPGHVYGWVIELRFDHDGRIEPAECKRIKEHLRPADSQ